MSARYWKLHDGLMSALRSKIVDPEVREKLHRVPARLNEFGYDPWGFSPDEAASWYSIGKFLYRHYSNSENEIEYGFYGSEAAAQQGYGWEYIYLFFANQDEADRFGVTEAENRRSGLGETFLDTLAGGVEELEDEEWEKAFEEGKVRGSAMEKSLLAQEELGSKLGIRYGLAMVLEGPRGNVTLQENPTLGEVERAIEQVE